MVYAPSRRAGTTFTPNESRSTCLVEITQPLTTAAVLHAQGRSHPPLCGLPRSILQAQRFLHTSFAIALWDVIDLIL